jgi:hypothetical protein
MKKLLLLTLTTLLISCYTAPQIDGDYPFIVTAIEAKRDTMAEYFGTYHYVSALGAESEGNSSIILPARMYNIGDTITFTNKTYTHGK